jgi:hypothetical protein
MDESISYSPSLVGVVVVVASVTVKEVSTLSFLQEPSATNKQTRSIAGRWYFFVFMQLFIHLCDRQFGRLNYYFL